MLPVFVDADEGTEWETDDRRDAMVFVKVSRNRAAREGAGRRSERL